MFASRSRCAANRVATPSASGGVILCPLGCRKTEVADFSGNRLGRVLAMIKSFPADRFRGVVGVVQEDGTLQEIMGAKSKSVSASPPPIRFRHVHDLLRKGCPVGVTEHPALSRLRREGIPALCRRPWPFRAGAEMATPNGRRYSEWAQCNIGPENDLILIQINRASESKCGVPNT